MGGKSTFPPQFFPTIWADGVCYMSPFWNHILANLANLSMCLLKFPGTSAVCTWGLRGNFFSDLYFLVLSLPVSCFLAVIFPTVRTNSNTLIYFGMTTCALATSAEWLRAHLPHQHRPSVIAPPSLNMAAVTSYLWSIHTQYLIAPLNYYIRHGYWCPPLRGDTPCWGTQSPEALLIDIRRQFCWCGCIDHLSCCCHCISCHHCLGG